MELLPERMGRRKWIKRSRRWRRGAMTSRRILMRWGAGDVLRVYDDGGQSSWERLKNCCVVIGSKQRRVDEDFGSGSRVLALPRPEPQRQVCSCNDNPQLSYYYLPTREMHSLHATHHQSVLMYKTSTSYIISIKPIQDIPVDATPHKFPNVETCISGELS